MPRPTVGRWRHVATAQQHDLTLDTHGQPTYPTAGDWNTVVAWPCSLETVRGGEIIRGRQVAPQTTHLLTGEYYGGRIITPDMRVSIPDIDNKPVIYQVIAAYDPDGEADRFIVELRKQFRQQVPVLSVADQEVTVGVAISYTPTTTAQVELWAAVGLPVGTGITFDTVTGEFAGTPNATDLASTPITVTVTGTNEGGTSDNALFDFEVSAAP